MASDSRGDVAGGALGTRGVDLLAPALEDRGELLLGALVAAGFAQPVGGQAHADEDEAGEAGGEGPVELPGLELVVVQVGLQVGGELELAAHLLAPGAHVERGVHEPRDDGQEGDDGADGLHSARGEEGWGGVRRGPWGEAFWRGAGPG